MGSVEEIRSHWNWAPRSRFFNNSEFSLTWRLARNALALLGLNFRAGLVDMPDCARCGCSLEETAASEFARSGSRRGVDGSHRTQAARAARRWLRRGQRSSSVSLCGVSRDPSCISNGD